MKLFSVIAGLLCVLIGISSAVAQEPASPRKKARPKRDFSSLLDRFDKNKDGILAKDELPAPMLKRLSPFDANKDGTIDREEFKKASQRLARRLTSRRPGEITTGPARGERHQDRLKVGDSAPDFTLADPKGDQEVTLSSFRGKKPVVLIFGSYT